MTRLTTDQVARKIRSTLGPSVFQPNQSRIGWFFTHLAILVGIYVAGYQFGVKDGELNFMLLLPMTLVAGLSFAGLAFVGHEALHGAITRNLRLKTWLGRIGFAPFCVSPRLWSAWHNRVHHNNTNVDGLDPDAYPTLEEYQSSKAARLAIIIASPHSRKWRGLITLLFGFSIQSTQVLLGARQRGHLSARHHRRALLDTAMVAALWLGLAWLLGPARFALLYVVPLMIANVVVMSYIVTNHSLNPLVPEDDTLASSLSVTTPSWYEAYSLQFGYHVEHHLFPSMSHIHGPKVRDEIMKLAPQRYQSMGLGQALRAVFSSPRVYKESSLLYDPDTGRTQRTLLPRSAQVVEPTELMGAASSDYGDDLNLEQTHVRLKAGVSQSQPPPSAGQMN